MGMLVFRSPVVVVATEAAVCVAEVVVLPSKTVVSVGTASICGTEEAVLSSGLEEGSVGSPHPANRHTHNSKASHVAYRFM